MSSKAYALLAALVFAVVAALHFWRAYKGIPIEIGGHEVSILSSWIVGGVTALLALMGLTSRG